MTPTAPRPYPLCAVTGPAVQGADVLQDAAIDAARKE